MQQPKKIYLTSEEFEKDLEICLTIVSYPNKYKKFYICEYFSAALEKAIVHIYIKN